MFNYYLVKIYCETNVRVSDRTSDTDPHPAVHGKTSMMVMRNEID